MLGIVTLVSGGCSDRPSRSRITAGASQRTKNDTAFLVEAVADGLNDLPSEIVLDLTPPKPILDDAKSADGQPVLALCDVTPAVPDGPYNYISIPKGNANFRKIGVKPGDVVRLFAKYDQELLERGYEQIGFFELVVRRLDQFNPDNALIVEGGLSGPVQVPTRIEIWRFSDRRMNEIRQRLTRYLQKPQDTIGWEPSADESALDLLIERANQWLRNLDSEESTWKVSPLIAQLPEEIRKSKPITELIDEKNLTDAPFETNEARQLQQAIWLRDIATWAKGEAVSPLDVAESLFDWTIRNVQLDDSNEPPGFVHQPWQVLMYGHGTAEQRGWVFAELCRQQQLDIVMLAIDDTWWLPALLHDDELYLFDTRLGLPIPGKNRDSIATLSELTEDPTLLEQLNIDGEDSYPASTENIENASAWIVATPLQLSQRAFLLEQGLEGDDYVVLAAGTERLTETMLGQETVDQVSLWPQPFTAILEETSMNKVERVRAMQSFIVFAQRPRLWKARVLHFQGTKEISIEDRNDPLAQPDRGHRRAIALYQDPRVRPSKKQLQQIEPSKRTLYELSKTNASYWLGLLSYDLGKYRIAEDWLAKRTLEARPNGPWTSGAKYNLARTYEATGELANAIELLEADQSPQRLGNLLRARQLKAMLAAVSDPNEE